MNFLFSFIATAGLVLEAISVSRFWTGQEFTAFILIHSLAIFSVIFALWAILKNIYQKFSYLFIFFLISLSLLLPLLGVLCSCFLTFIAYKFNESRNEHLIKTIKRKYDEKPLEVGYGMGGVRARLQSEKFPLSKKTAALFAMGSTRLDVTNSILQEVLKDEQDELRLLAFGLLHYQEEDIYKRILTTINLLQSKTNSLEPASLHKQIAELYWEIIYRGLSPDMEKIILKNARNYAEKAVKKLNNHPSIWILLGKIYHRLNNADLAQEMFEKAKNLGASPKQFIPYLAENAYRQRNFSQVKDFFNSADFLSDIPTIGPVARFWIKEYDNKK
jgi:hypothetical protein